MAFSKGKHMPLEHIVKIDSPGKWKQTDIQIGAGRKTNTDY